MAGVGEGNEDKTCRPAFGVFCVDLEELLEIDHVIELATLFEFQPADIDRIESHRTPGSEFVCSIRSMGIIGPDDISKLTKALEDLDLLGVARNVHDSFTGTVRRRTMPVAASAEEDHPISEADASANRSDYPFLIDEKFVEYKSDEIRLTILNEDAKEECEKRLQRYSLPHTLPTGPPKSGVKDIRIVMIGKTGSGKSATANTILGEDFFQEGNTSKSETRASYAASRPLGGDRTITVMDSPGLKDTRRSDREVLMEVSRAAYLMREGIHVFVLVWNASKIRFTKEDQEVIESIKKGFGEAYKSHCILVYSNAERMDMSLKDFIETQKKHGFLGAFLKEMDWSVVAVNNNAQIPVEKERNREVILCMIDEIIHRNRGGAYTNDLFMEVNDLYKRLPEIAASNGCHSCLVSASVEAYNSHTGTISVIHEGLFYMLVLRIMTKSKTVSTNGQLIFLEEGESKIEISEDDFKRQVAYIFNKLLTISGTIKTLFSRYPAAWVLFPITGYFWGAGILLKKMSLQFAMSTFNQKKE